MATPLAELVTGGPRGAPHNARVCALAPWFRQQHPPRCQHSAWALAVHGHAEPVGGFFGCMASMRSATVRMFSGLRIGARHLS